MLIVRVLQARYRLNVKRVIALVRSVFSMHGLCTLAGFYTLVALQLDHFADDPGLGWHLKTGEFVVQHGTPPVNDPFLAGQVMRPWISDQWLSDVILWKGWEFGGWALLYSGCLALFVLTFFVVLYRGLRASEIGGSCITTSLAVLIACKLAQIHFILRPVIFSIVIFCLVFVLLLNLLLGSELMDGPAHRLQRKVWWLPPIFAVWANLHPAFVLGLILMLLCILDCCVKTLLSRRAAFANGWRQASLVQWCAVAALSAAATVINPYGIELHRSIVALASSPYFMMLHEEWLPLRIASVEGQGVLFVLAVIIGGVFVSRGWLWGAGIYRTMCLVIFSYLAFRGIRFLPYFAIVASAMFAPALWQLCSVGLPPKYPLLRRLQSTLGKVEFAESRVALPMIMAWLGAGLFVLGALIGGRTLFYGGELGPSAGRYPYAALKALLQSLAPGDTAIVASHPNWGGFITWQGGGRLRALVDDRNTLIGEQFYREYSGRVLGGEQWEAFLQEQRATHVLLPPGFELVQRLENQILMYSDSTSVLTKLVLRRGNPG